MHYDSLLEELVRTHGGARANEEYDKLKQDKARLIETIKGLLDYEDVHNNLQTGERVIDAVRKIVQEVSHDNT